MSTHDRSPAGRTRHFGTFTGARSNLRALLDAAHDGLITTLDRGHERFVVVTARDLAEDLRRLRPASAVVVAEGGGWVALIPGVPVHGDAATVDAALEDLVQALREYAADWNERLHLAPNHAQHRALVRIVELSDDEQLRLWLIDTDQPSSVAAPTAVTV